MTSPHDRQAELDRYLDGAMDPPERERFEVVVANDPALARERELQSVIDGTLKRSFAPPSAAVIGRLLDDAATNEVDASPRNTMRFGRIVKIAAAIVLCVTGLWLTITSLRGRQSSFVPYTTPTPQTLVEAYEAEVKDGFTPDWICRDDAEFQATFEDRFGQALALAELPEGAATLGLSYGHTLSKWTLHLLVRADGDPIMLYVDRADRATTPAVPVDDGLYVHERTLGHLVVYELSPREQPVVLDRLEGPKEVTP